MSNTLNAAETAARREILDRLRACRISASELPDLATIGSRYDDPLGEFCRVLETVGGRTLRAASMLELESQLEQIPAYAQAQRVCSVVDGVARANVPPDSSADPHRWEQVDVFVAPGRFAVAENGAVWVDDTTVPHRVLYFVVQHLVLVVPADQIVHNLHEAYQRLSFEKPGFGLFISGPSKTADIEQSLVIGAHGARSLTVVLTGGGLASG